MIEVFIPTWNNERTIKECIQSLKQTSTELDITIVDNLSSDATAEIRMELLQFARMVLSQAFAF
jgi:glycosyltransferase involved in cell wall biosynthesis